MLNKPQRSKLTLFIPLIFLLLVCTIISLAGCAGNGNIPSAGILDSGEVTLAWDEVVGAESYSVYFSTSPGVTVLNSYKISNASNPFTITNLEPGTTYYFVVIVKDASGQSRRSKEISYTAVDTKGSIQFGDILSQSYQEATISKFDNLPGVSLSISDSAAKSELQERQITSSQSKNASAKSKNKPTVKASAPNSAVRSERQVRQIASSQSKDASAKSKKKPTVKASIPATGEVTLGWDNVPNATSYNIYWSDSPGVSKKKGNKIPNVENPHKITCLEKGKKYYFVITAVNATGESKESEEFSFIVKQ